MYGTGLAICYWEIIDFILDGYWDNFYDYLLEKWLHIYGVSFEIIDLRNIYVI